MQFCTDQDDEMQSILMKSADTAKHFWCRGLEFRQPLQIVEIIWSTNVQ